MSRADEVIERLQSRIVELEDDLGETELRALKFIHQCNAHADLYRELKAERDELRAQVEAMRAVLRDAAKGVHWLQAHVPMTKDAQWHAYHTRAAIESALQAKP